MCGDEFLTEAQREAVIEEIGRRLSALIDGVISDRPWPGLIPAGLMRSHGTPVCRICESAGMLTCPLHGLFRWPAPVAQTAITLIGSC